MRALIVALALLGAGVMPQPSTKTHKTSPSLAKTGGTRRLAPGELVELARTALANSHVRLPKGARVIAARPQGTLNVVIPGAPSNVTIDLTPPPRRAGPVTATAVVVFWNELDVSARLPVHLDLSVPPEALVYDVSKGAPVTLMVRRGLVEVSAPAVASSDADVGDVLQFLLRPSGRVLRGELVAKDRALAIEDGR